MKYPNNIIKIETTKIKNYKNRGMTLENDLNNANNYYLEHNIAVIHKKPTPIKVLETKYKEGKKQEITRAIYEEKSTTDYNGVYKGKYIDFEAKETNNTTFFPLKNIHCHQINHIEKVLNQKGIAYIIISFIRINEVYILPGNKLLELTKNNMNNINIEYLKENGYQLKYSILPKLNYLKIIDKLMEKENQNDQI